MRWSIIRLIWLRELRDQLRDRRTLFMVAGLPLLLYPLLSIAVLKFAVGFVDRKINIGIVTDPGKPQEFPSRSQPWVGRHPAPAVSLLSLMPAAPGNALPVDRAVGAAALAEGSRLATEYPLLVHDGKFDELYLQLTMGRQLIQLSPGLFQIKWLEGGSPEKIKQNRALLDDGKIDVLLSASADFWDTIERGRPNVRIEVRPNDEGSRQGVQRLEFALVRWKNHLKVVRFVRNGLPVHYDDPFGVEEPDAGVSSTNERNLLNMLVKIFPFMLVMWSLAGALYPAIDLCAGEKERGTMETLLISPAGREEIVWGKFLTIWVFSAGTALLNVCSMGITTWAFSSQLPQVALTPGGLFWCVLLLLPLSAFFSAVCLAIGAYARSSKEGQYYLMPLFLVTMPLIFLTLAPGVELNSFYSMVPVTGVALLMQRLLTSVAMDQHPWFYMILVMAPIGLYSWLALRWAIDQFQREEVLFREAERIDVSLWLHRLFREKETRPTTGMAVFCFCLLLGLRWFSLGLGSGLPLLIRNFVVVAAFVVGPPVFMALILTKRPRQVLGMHLPAWPYTAAAVLLIPLVELTFSFGHEFPRLLEELRARQVLVEQAYTFNENWAWSLYLVAIALVTAGGQEIAFRGFIFSGLLMRMRPWPAILVSSFLYAAFHMNVFLVPPLFVFGVALGVLALRSGSLFPGIILHTSCYALLIRSTRVGDAPLEDGAWDGTALQYLLVGATTLAAAGLLWWQNRRSGSGFLAALIAVPKPVTPTATTWYENAGNAGSAPSGEGT